MIANLHLQCAMSHAVIDKCAQQDIAVVFAGGRAMLEGYFMLKAPGERSQRLSKLQPLFIFDIEILTRGKITVGDRHLDVRCIVIINTQFTHPELHLE